MLPESLRDLLVASVRRLPEETQDAVRVASAGGERTGHGLLAAVAGLDLAGLARALRPAVAANVLLTDEDGFVFRHALIREAVHDELLPGESSQLHSRFAEAINADPALVPPGRAPIEQAYHWYAAHDTARALVSAWAAAAEFGHALAHAEQLAMLSRVLELWDQVPGAAQRIGADHVAVLEAAIRVAELAGEYDRGVALAQAALKEIDTSSRTGPGRAAVRGPRPPELPARPPWLHRRPARGGPAGARRPADRGPGPGPRIAGPRYPSRALGRTQFLASAEEAVAVARQAGDPATEAAALVTLACAQSLGGDLAGSGPCWPRPARWPPRPGRISRCCASSSQSQTCWRDSASTSRRPRWPGRDSRPPPSTGWPGRPG